MSDLIERTRPDLSAEWTPARRTAALEALLDAPDVRHRGRRWLIGAGAATVVGALAVPVALPGWFASSAAAAELEGVAAAASRKAGLTWGAGQFLHVLATTSQTGMIDSDRGLTPIDLRLRIDDWRDPEGWTWSRRASTRDGVTRPREYYLFEPGWGWMRPGYAATMPTEAHALDLFLRTRVSGSTSQDEAVFVAIGDMLKQEAAPPDLQAAAIRTLGLNPKVRVTREKDPSGRPAVKATFIDEGARPGSSSSLFLDPATGALLAEQDTWPDGRYQSVIDRREVVDRLPAEIVAKLGTEHVAQDGSGEKVPGGSPMPDPTPHPSETYTPYPTPGR